MARVPMRGMVSWCIQERHSNVTHVAERGQRQVEGCSNVTHMAERGVMMRHV